MIISHSSLQQTETFPFLMAFSFSLSHFLPYLSLFSLKLSVVMQFTAAVFFWRRENCAGKFSMARKPEKKTLVFFRSLIYYTK
jgi:hypothetical protein